MGLLAKPMVVTLPFVLLLLDYWPLRRLSIVDCRLSIFLEKVPLFVLAAASCIVTVIAQTNVIRSVEDLPLGIRIANTLISYTGYIEKVIWPCNLAYLYPHPRMIPWWRTVQACLFIGLISLLAIRLIKQRPCLAVGWFWYMGTLVPVIGLVQVGLQAMADRYTYVPLIGLSIMMIWGFETENRKTENRVSNFKFQISDFKPSRAFISSIVLAYLSILMTSTWLQVQYWSNGTTLYEHAINVTTDNDLAHYSLGNDLLDQRRLDGAIKHFTEVLRLDPHNYRAHNGIGIAFFYKGNCNEAAAFFRKALQINPDSVNARNNLQKVLAVQKKNNKASAENPVLNKLSHGR